MSTNVGTGKNEELLGSSDDDFLAGEGGNDTLIGGSGNDTLLGGRGDDVIKGGDGDDTAYGGASVGGTADMSKLVIAEDAKATVTFEGESAGYKNAIGVYKIAADGTITGVQILFANASLKGSGGDLVGGESSVDLGLKAGEKLGFFVVPNGFAQKGMDKLLGDTDGSFKFVDSQGNPANANNGSDLRLVHVSANGRETDIKSQYGTNVFHSDASLNADGKEHVKGTIDVANGELRLGFEDLWNGGDKDYDDSVLTIKLGETNAALLPRADTKPGDSSDNDLIKGGAGNDKLFGMSGDDIVKGGSGDDRIWGNSGDDKLFGNAGDDELRGGSGNDSIRGGRGNDFIDGNSGDDVIRGGNGNDRMFGSSGNDVIKDGRGDDHADGGSGDDVFVAGDGNDTYVGGSGSDTLDFSGAKNGVTVDISKGTSAGWGDDTFKSIEHFVGSRFDDTFKGSSRADSIDGGSGDDIIRGLGGSDVMIGGDGADTFVWLAKDLDGSVDVISDFSADDVLDLHDVLKNQSYGSIDEVVRLTETTNGTLVSVLMGDKFVDVVMLTDVHGMSAMDLLNDGMLLS